MGTPCYTKDARETASVRGIYLIVPDILWPLQSRLTKFDFNGVTRVDLAEIKLVCNLRDAKA